MRKIQRRKSDFMVKCQRGSAVYQQFKGIGVQDVRWTSALHGSEWNGDLSQQAKMRGYIPEHCLPICKKRKERIKFMRDLEKVCIQQKYNYCTGEERFTFIKLPKCLVEDECFIELSMDAKLLYAFFLDRVSLSIKNICKNLNCGTQKACKLLDELEKVGALERKRQGLGRTKRPFQVLCKR